MPIYAFECHTCKSTFDKSVTVSKRDDPVACQECGAETHRLVSVSNFNLVGDGWAGKNNRIAGQMRKKNDRLRGKEDEMKRDAPAVKLTPNVGGERVDSWAEAAKLAKSSGKDTAGYEKMARTEKASR